jgi:hypothetical protein
MSRGVYSFKEKDLSRAIRATVKAGVTGWRIEIADGKIIVVAATPATAAPQDDPNVNEWDTVK